ncbi:hypothetical protein OSB04_030149 [Centaurea solstitialis]|uniref:Protein kinase domain-containing protein n=1 Tax=Centaurea solstitialis TaxID=347529 RepID=A0AA38SJA6_9ASTR|nr:hypothetical protein OSB04_030149 [Centaurea solstitialis]
MAFLDEFQHLKIQKTMDFLDEFQHLKMQLDEIKLATDDFANNNVIGVGGFGKVYKGSFHRSKGPCVAAFKRLDRVHGQGDLEFWKEILMLSRYTHENIISLLGYCDEDGEKILAYEYSSRGSLDRHLGSTALTWTQRLKICLEVARGLSYLHDPRETQQRVLHRDIKSSNILLDENWKAKLSDLGLSKIGPANQKNSVLVTNVAGSYGYIDPLYMETYTLTKESDVYSFGVVLFEVLCGRVCYQFSNGEWKVLVPMWRKSYKRKNLDEIIFQHLKQQTDWSSLEAFSHIAYQCLKSREKRPTMAEVVGKLENALEFQESYDDIRESKDYGAIAKTVVPPLIYGSEEELYMLLSKGIVWFSVNKNGEHIEMISAVECSTPTLTSSDYDRYSKEISRFGDGSYLAYGGKFKAHIRTRFLSPGITYTVNLVFKFLHTRKHSSERTYLPLRYRLQGEISYSYSYLALEREDGWMMVELYHFIGDKRNFDKAIQFNSKVYGDDLIVDSIEFRPMEKVESEAVEEVEDMQPTSESDKDWEQKLPKDYEQIIKWSKDSMEWTTKKELYIHFCKGFLINNGEEWFSLHENGKKCYMLPARAILKESDWRWKPARESRFEEVACDPFTSFGIVCTIKSKILSPETKYACYLVFKITKDHHVFEAPTKVMDKDFHLNARHVADFWFIYLHSPPPPIIRSKLERSTRHNQFNRHKMKGLPQQRNDGWMEVQVWEFTTSTITEMISMRFHFINSASRSLIGLTIQGIEFKPMIMRDQAVTLRPRETNT